jgi:rhamnulokinase
LRAARDTGEAVAAVPSQDGGWAFLSSGTWSLIGVELERPLITEEARTHNFTNEAGYGGTTRFLKNIVGLWILQESRRAWARQGLNLDYASLTAEGEKAQPFRSLINPNAARSESGRNAETISAYAVKPVSLPRNSRPVARCILKPRAVLPCDAERNRTDYGRSIARLHIVGGGSRSAL